MLYLPLSTNYTSDKKADNFDNHVKASRDGPLTMSNAKVVLK
jgi:hypothetical protein